jgi:type II secretory pathway pseudopilin PulG
MFQNKSKKIKYNKGMTYVELIVVLSIFSAMTAVVLFNYGTFQAKVDIKNLANDIALKLVEAQKSANFGVITTHNVVNGWKPAYGTYFTVTADGLADNKSFNYFADTNNSTGYDDGTCNPSNLSTECLEKFNITKGNYISSITVFYQNGTTQNLNEIITIYTRPSLAPVFRSRSALSAGIDYIKINISSPNGPVSNIKVYASGRIQIN